MTALKALPLRPSLDSLRKQAKKLARDVAAADPKASARVRAQLPEAEGQLALRDAQLVLAREYGFAGWHELMAEVHNRLGLALEWAASEARRIIHDNDVAGLKRLLAEYPSLLSWKDAANDGGLLAIATTSFGDSGDPTREQKFTRAACAELLIDAGATLSPSVCDRLINDRARGLLHLFQTKGLLPPTLKFFAALGDLEAVRAHVDAAGNDFSTVHAAFWSACHLEHPDVASFLLNKLIALDADLGKRIDGGPGRTAFLAELVGEHVLHFTHAAPADPWQTFVMQHIVHALHDDDLATFVGGLQRESWLLGDSCVEFQVGLIEHATLRDRSAFISALLDLRPALLQRRPPPQSQAIEFAFTYAKLHLVPILTRIWPLPDDLPHAAGTGDIARVKRWFDESGRPTLGEIARHFPANSPYNRGNLQWGVPSAQQILDTALAWSVLNGHFEVADFLLEHGADINTTWGSHEPASILHECALRKNYDAARFLIDHGIDLTIRDYRWNATAAGWAYNAAQDKQMYKILKEGETRRNTGSQ